jgi:hypothetical protein
MGGHAAAALAAPPKATLKSRWVVDAPWPPRIGPLERAWDEPREAHGLGRPLADFFAELVRRLEPGFVRDFPAPVSRPGVDSIRTEPRGTKGVAWTASLRRDEAGHVVEREVVLWSRGVAAGEVMLAWRRDSEPGEPAVTHVELAAEGPAEAIEGMEELVERMLSEATRRLTPVPALRRASTPPSPPASISAASGDVTRRIAAVVLALLGALASTTTGHGALTSMKQSARRDALRTVVGKVVEARAASHRTSWMRDDAGLVAELTATYEVDGRSFTTTFFDPSLGRRTPSIVRALAERTWLGRDVPFLVDPAEPARALQSPPASASWPATRLAVAALIGLVSTMLLLGALADAWLGRRPPTKR